MFVARCKWRRRYDDIRKLERNAYLNSPAFRYLRWVVETHGVDRCIDALLEMVGARPKELLKGSSAQATALKEMVRLVTSGSFKFIAGDLEGQGANAWDWGVSFIDENDEIYPLSDQSNGHLPKSVATGYSGRYSHTHPSLISTNFYDMLADMFIITDIAAEDDAMCFHYGGRESELLKALGVPDGLFIDALKIIRHILGAKMNGVFSDDVPYGDQLRTASTSARFIDRADAVPRAGPVLLYDALLRARPDAHRYGRRQFHLLAHEGFRRRFNPAPRRRARDQVLPAAEPRVGPRRRARSEAPAARRIPRPRLDGEGGCGSAVVEGAMNYSCGRRSSAKWLTNSCESF